MEYTSEKLDGYPPDAQVAIAAGYLAADQCFEGSTPEEIEAEREADRWRILEAQPWSD